uniref:TOG domain-containing protein n=1 Tax=Heliothis virescens TaxID=7102 RepID=A0A2A4JEQ4_HELVI
MQLPETPPPPLAPLWDRVLRARALPPDLDVELLYVAIRDRLTHPEWEVRLHALRVLADLLPLSGNALSFPFDQVVDNLGHNSPNVRKAALDALKVFCTHCEDVECAARALLDKCSYHNIRPHSADIDTKVNVITGLILSIPSVMGILKRRHSHLDMLPIFQVLGEKLFDPIHRDVAQRSLLKLRRACGPRDYMIYLSRLDPKVQDRFRHLCETYDEDSMDVYYAPRKTAYRNNNNQPLVKINHVFNNNHTGPIRVSTDSSSEDSFGAIPFYNNNFGKVIIETEIKFDSDTAITMTVLEENETESEKNTGSEDDYDSSDRNMLKYSDGDSEDTDVVVKRVRFGGESVKIRTPDSDNLLTSEDDNNFHDQQMRKDNYKELMAPVTPAIVSRMNEIKRAALERESQIKLGKKSGIPLPVIQNKTQKPTYVAKYNGVKVKSKSLSELYDYFRSRNDEEDSKISEMSGLALSLAEVRSPEKSGRSSRSPVEPHKEVEVLHNLQRSPSVSPRRHQTRVELERDGFVLSLLASSPLKETDILTPRTPTPLRSHYDWEELGVVPQHVSDQLHNTENWIAAVRAADQLHSTLLEPSSVRKVEPAALSLVHHMWALSDEVAAARAPAEGAVCALVRGVSSDCARQLLPALISRMAREPLPAALPHALLQRLALHHIVDLIFDPSMIGVAAARAPAEGAVCALVRGVSSDCARQLLPALISRMAREPLPAALPHALLQRLALHHIVDLIFDPSMIGVSGDKEMIQSAQLRATLCLARAAGPAAVLSAVRRRLAGTARADVFCNKLRERLSRPIENIRPSHVSRSSQLPVPVRRRARSTPPPAPPPPPRRLRPLPDSAPLPGVSQPGRDYIPFQPLSPIPLSDRDSSALTSYEDGETIKKASASKESDEKVIQGDSIEVKTADADVQDSVPSPPRSPSIRVEDYSEKSNLSPVSARSQLQVDPPLPSQPGSAGTSTGHESIESRASTVVEVSPVRTVASARPSPTPPRSSAPSPARSGVPTPEPASDVYDEPPRPAERDVRTALAECIVPARHEDWEVIVSGLVETERLAADPAARAPAASWRSAARSAATHVRSLRSRVARAACGTLGALFEHRGRALDPEVEEAAGALLERCADVNRFLRADAANALVKVARGGSEVRAVVALSRRGATHRAGPVRAAAAAALAQLVRHGGASHVLALPSDIRTSLLRAAGELLADANADTRQHARQLCLALGEDVRFRPMLKEAMPPSRYRAIEKYVDKLRYR